MCHKSSMWSDMEEFLRLSFFFVSTFFYNCFVLQKYCKLRKIIATSWPVPICIEIIQLFPKIHHLQDSSKSYKTYQSQWRNNGRGCVSNHQPHDCLLNRLFRRRSMKTSQLRVTGLCVGNSPVTGEFPAQEASNTENVPIWWHHHAESCLMLICIYHEQVCGMTHRPRMRQYVSSVYSPAPSTSICGFDTLWDN